MKEISKIPGAFFQKKVWQELLKIPKGQTRSYKEIAVAIGNPKAARAVANACGKNPYPTKNTLSQSNKIRRLNRRV